MPQRDDRVARAVLATSKLPNRLAYATRAVIDGFWLGILSERRLRAVDERYYGTTTMYQTREWNERGLFDWETRMIEEHFPRSGTIAVIGAGGGREVLALRKDGYDAIGYESHPDLVEFGEKLLASHGFPSCVRIAPRDAFPSEAGPCSGVIIGWGAYSLIFPRARRVRLLEDVRDHVLGGGPVLVSYFERPDDNREIRWIKTVADTLRRVRRVDAIELGDRLGPNAMHVFSREQIEEESSAAGFEVAEHRTIAESEPSVLYACAVLRVSD